MNLTNNTILITGGGSGIGKGLAEAFHALGNQVIIAGRRQHLLDKTTAANPGMYSIELDIEKPEAIQAFALQVTGDRHFRFGVCPDGDDAYLLRDQSGHSLVHAVASLSA
jgi:short-subunit dehydrogenase involved in D-alanine esterification of teichoic acids